MSADADCSSTAGTLSATLPRSFRPSSLLRRRIAGDAEPTNNSGLRLSMPMAGDALDFLDFSAFINNGGAGNGAGGEENMLQALLSSLPEPPAFTAVSARLGPKLSQRLTVGDAASKPHLGTMMPGSAFGQKHEPVSFDGSLATPAPSRRNTDESVDSLSARLQQQPSVDSLTSAASTSDTVGSVVVAAAELLAAEMPPVSPFFARVSFADIDDARETVRRASLSRRRSRTLADSYDRHAASWCAPSSTTAAAPGRLSLAEITRALRNPCTPPSDELLINQPPPTSPLFAHIVPEACRWFRVNVYGLLTSQTARVTVSELNSPQKTIDVTDPAVQKALGRYPLVLALAARQQQKQQQKPESKRPTRMRVPSRRSQPGPAVLTAPTLSFTVSTNSAAAAADRRVRSVDVDAMAAAYLPPHIHALLSESSPDTAVPEDAAVVGECLRTPSQSSTATLGEHCEAEAAKPAPRSLLRRPQRRSDIGAVGSLKDSGAGVMGPLKGGDTGLPTPRQLRASASVMNLRGAYAERASAQQALALRRSTTASISQIGAPPQAVSRRRSEVQALITQANAVMSSGAVRRSSALDAAQGPRLLRPPRASFPLYSTPSLALLRSPGADAAPSGLRVPSSLAAALSRQQHRLEPARGLRHSVSSGDLALPLSMLAPVPLRSIGADVLAAPRIPRGSTPLSGIRPPPPPPPSAPAAAPARGPAAAQPTLLSRRPTPHTPLGGRVPGTARVVAGPPMSAGSSRLRHSGPSSAALRQSFNAPYYDGSDSDEPPPAAPSSGMGLRRLTSGSVVRARPGVQALFAGSACDEGFLTLRPVHTPDLVPRTIDPRLIERAMTPMLKTNVGIQYSSLVDLVRSAATITADDDDDDLESLPPIHLPTLSEVSPAAEMPQSRFSPINSPERSPVLAPVGGKLSKPGFLARYRSAKTSTAPLPVSAIPLPPATPVQKPAAVPPPQSRALGLSNIPTLRKARSLWAMRSSPGKK